MRYVSFGMDSGQHQTFRVCETFGSKESAFTCLSRRCLVVWRGLMEYKNFKIFKSMTGDDRAVHYWAMVMQLTKNVKSCPYNVWNFLSLNMWNSHLQKHVKSEINSVGFDGIYHDSSDHCWQLLCRIQVPNFAMIECCPFGTHRRLLSEQLAAWNCKQIFKLRAGHWSIKSRIFKWKFDLRRIWCECAKNYTSSLWHHQFLGLIQRTINDLPRPSCNKLHIFN